MIKKAMFIAGFIDGFIKNAYTLVEPNPWYLSPGQALVRKIRGSSWTDENIGKAHEILQQYEKAYGELPISVDLGEYRPFRRLGRYLTNPQVGFLDKLISTLVSPVGLPLDLLFGPLTFAGQGPHYNPGERTVAIPGPEELEPALRHELGHVVDLGTQPLGFRSMEDTLAQEYLADLTALGVAKETLPPKELAHLRHSLTAYIKTYMDTFDRYPFSKKDPFLEELKAKVKARRLAVPVK